MNQSGSNKYQASVVAFRGYLRCRDLIRVRMMSMDQGKNTDGIGQHTATAIESIFGTFINSKTEDVLQKILLKFSELDLNAIGNSRHSDVEDALVRADGKSKAGTLDFQTLLQLRDCLRLQLHLECNLS